MEFGGVYVVAEGIPTRRDLERAIQGVQELWPRSVFEAPNFGTTPTGLIAIPNIPDVEEFVIYEDMDALYMWEDLGRTEVNADSVVYARLEPDRLIFLVGRLESSIGKLIQALSYRSTVRHPSDLSSHHRVYVDRAIPLNGSGIHRHVAEVACT